MEWTWPESVTSNRQRVMEELVQGREMANQLKSCISGDVRSAEGLVSKILGSLTTTLLILNGSQEDAKEELISQIQANSPSSTFTGSGSGSAAGVDSSSWDAPDDAVKSEDTNEESYKSTDRETLKDRRGSYKRRKTAHSWTKDTLELVDDGHAWRKYGQKSILNNDYPRNYFRCTHKFDQGCKATKHVQRIEDKPPLYRTTYYGNHTCTDYLRAPEHILDCASSQESTKNMISFDTANNDNCSAPEEYPYFSSFTSIKKESVKEEEIIKPISDYDHANRNQSQSSCDHLTWPVLGVLESSGPINRLSSIPSYEFDDVFRMEDFHQYEADDYLYGY